MTWWICRSSMVERSLDKREVPGSSPGGRMGLQVMWGCGAAVNTSLCRREDRGFDSRQPRSEMLERTCSRSSADRTRSCDGRGHRFKSCREHFGYLEGECAGARSLFENRSAGNRWGSRPPPSARIDDHRESEPRRPGACLEGKAAPQGTGVRLLRSPLGSQKNMKTYAVVAQWIERRPSKPSVGSSILSGSFTRTQFAPVAQRRRHLSYKEAHHDAGSSPAGSIVRTDRGRDKWKASARRVRRHPC